MANQIKKQEEENNKKKKQEEEEKKNLYIIITNSLQNDFIEKEYIDEIKTDKTEDPWKVSYDTCRKKWMKYFRKNNFPPKEKYVNNFLNWMKPLNDKMIYPKSENIEHSYHKFIKKYKHRVHIDIEQSDRLWNNDRLKIFIDDLMRTAADVNKQNSEDEYYFIHLRDWHDSSNPYQREELTNFGHHCIKGSHGAKFIDPLVDYINDIPYNRFTQVINSNSLSSFYETKLDFILESIIDNNNSSTEKVRIGVFGVVTDVKLKLLTFELKVVHNYKKVYVCKDLSAGFNQKGHKDGIKYMKYVLGAKVYGEDKFRKKFNIKRQVLTI